MRACLRMIFVLILGLVCSATIWAQGDNPTDPLIRVLQAKGVLTEPEVRAITSTSPAEQRDRLAVLLRDKGIISASELEAVRSTFAAVKDDHRRLQNTIQPGEYGASANAIEGYRCRGADSGAGHRCAKT